MHRITAVIPVYRGQTTLAGVVEELVGHSAGAVSPSGEAYSISQIVLVNDAGPDDSARVIRSLVAAHDVVEAVWLSRNFGQHPATFAGVAASTGDWVVTLDEDGQHDPTDVPTLLDEAVGASAQVVYGRPMNPPHHGALRNAASRLAKSVIARLSGNQQARNFSSFRLIEGDLARGVTEFTRHGTYFDVALGWVAGRYSTADITLRPDQRSSGYSMRTLAAHFLRLVISSGTRILRAISVAGIVLALVGITLTIWIVVVKVFFGIDSEGWASLAVALAMGFGAMLFTLGFIAEYLSALLDVALGKPAYFVTADRAHRTEERSSE